MDSQIHGAEARSTLATGSALLAAKQIASSYPQNYVNVEAVAQLIDANFACVLRAHRVLRDRVAEFIRKNEGEAPVDALKFALDETQWWDSWPNAATQTRPAEPIKP